MKNNAFDSDLKNLDFIKQIKLETGTIGGKKYVLIGDNDIYGNFLNDLKINIDPI